MEVTFSDNVQDKLVTFAAERLEKENYKGNFKVEELQRVNMERKVFSEFAVAKALGLRFKKYMMTRSRNARLNNGKSCLIVKTKSGKQSDLLIYEHSYDHCPNVLVKAENYDRMCRVVGWVFAGEVKKQKYLATLREGVPPCYVIPPRDLRPIDELKEIIAGTGIKYFHELFELESYK